MIDFRRDKIGVPAKVETIEYDPNRSAFIALLSYADGEFRYILQPVGLKVGMSVVAGPEADILVGNSLPLKNIPLGTTIHNIELRPGKGAHLARVDVGFYALDSLVEIVHRVSRLGRIRRIQEEVHIGLAHVDDRVGK